MTQELILQEEVKKWINSIVTVRNNIGKNGLELGKILWYGKEKDLWQNLVEEGKKFKSFRDFLDSKIVGISRRQAEKCMKAYEYVQNVKLAEDKAIEIGVEKLALGQSGQAPAHFAGLKPDDLKKHSTRDLKALQDGVRRLDITMSEEYYRDIEQALATFMKVEKTDSKAEALHKICVDYMSGASWEHVNRKKTTRERMQDLWEWWKTIRYPNVDSKIADQNYTRYARTLQKLAVIEKAEEDRGIGTDGLKKGITAIFEWYQAFSKEKGLNTVDFTKVVGRYADYKNDPSQFEIKEEKDFNPATRKHKKEGESG